MLPMLRQLFSILVILVAWPSVSMADSEHPGRPIVVELYTSQGCSSCPPADKLLHVLRSDKKRNILPLSFHVDYWNSLGWKDEFSKPEFSERQRKYARHNGSPTIYTPQMVINGEYFVVGSRKSEVYGIIDRILKNRAADFREAGIAAPPRLINCSEGDWTKIIFDGNPELLRTKNYSLYYLKKNIGDKEVRITRGENARRTITYGNVVASIDEVSWSDETGVARFQANFDSSDLAGIVFLQEDGFGPIIDTVEIADTACEEMEANDKSTMQQAADIAKYALINPTYSDPVGIGSLLSAVAMDQSSNEPAYGFPEADLIIENAFNAILP